jgi:hypothetical protein
MKRYFDARAAPVNEEIIQTMNKLSTGGPRNLKKIAAPIVKTQEQLDLAKQQRIDKFYEEKFGNKNLRGDMSGMAGKVKVQPKRDEYSALRPQQILSVADELRPFFQKEIEAETKAKEAENQTEKKRIFKVVKSADELSPTDRQRGALRFLRESAKGPAFKQQTNEERRAIGRAQLAEMALKNKK